MNKIVFIEGVSGVGKTTTTKLLHAKLRNMGYTAYCSLEGDTSNPLDPFNGTYPPPISLTTFIDTYMQCWQNFVANQSGQDYILILDGTLLHHLINDLIRAYNASKESIAILLENLLLITQGFNPVIFYLESQNIGERLASALQSRGKIAPTEQKILFWEKRKVVDEYVLDKLSTVSYTLNVDNGWNGISESIIRDITKQI